MACLDMYNSEQHKGHCAPMSPRISFSNDFVESHSHHMIVNQERQSSREATPAGSSDFEFSVTNYSMMTADELFSKGRILPYKNKMQKPTTLRDELLAEHEDDQDIFPMPPKVSARWKGFLGLKKSHIGSKKADMEKIHSSKKLELVHEDMPLGKTSQLQEFLNEGEGSSCKDVEIGL